MNEPLAEMLRYNRWANLELFNSVRDLSAEQLACRMPEASGSVAELLLHIVGGQQTFLLRTAGRQHEGEYGRESAWPGFEALHAALVASNDQLVAIAEGLDEDREVTLPWMGKEYRFPVRFFLVHAMSHSAEHRTEVKLSLAHFGVPTPDLDGWFYAGAAGFGQEVGG